jgi:hypothetical protein
MTSRPSGMEKSRALGITARALTSVSVPAPSGVTTSTLTKERPPPCWMMRHSNGVCSTPAFVSPRFSTCAKAILRRSGPSSVGAENANVRHDRAGRPTTTERCPRAPCTGSSAAPRHDVPLPLPQCHTSQRDCAAGKMTVVALSMVGVRREGSKWRQPQSPLSQSPHLQCGLRSRKSCYGVRWRRDTALGSRGTQR